MAQTEQDASIYRGEHREIVFELLDDAGAPLDPAGTELRYRIARAADAPDFLGVDDVPVEADYDYDDGFLARVILTTALTQSLPSGAWYHELFQEDYDGERTVLATGTLTVMPSQAARG